MATQVTCGCGGVYEDTSSKRNRHNNTARHLGWVGTQQKAAKKAAKKAIPATTPVKVKTVAATSAQGETTKRTSKAAEVRAMLDSGAYANLTAVAKAAGITYEYAWDIRSAWLQAAK